MRYRVDLTDLLYSTRLPKNMPFIITYVNNVIIVNYDDVLINVMTLLVKSAVPVV